MAYKINPKQFWLSIEQLYKLRMNHFLKLASTHLENTDYAPDAVNDAFDKATQFFNKHPDRALREQIVEWLILKACKRYNKQGRNTVSMTEIENYVSSKTQTNDRFTDESAGSNLYGH